MIYVLYIRDMTGENINNKTFSGIDLLGWILTDRLSYSVCAKVRVSTRCIFENPLRDITYIEDEFE